MTNKIEILELKLNTVESTLTLKIKNGYHMHLMSDDVKFWRCDSVKKLTVADLQFLRNEVFKAVNKLDSNYVRELQTTDGSEVTLNRGQVSIEFFDAGDFSWLSNSAYYYATLIKIGNAVKTFLSDIKTALEKVNF